MFFINDVQWLCFSWPVIAWLVTCPMDSSRPYSSALPARRQGDHYKKKEHRKSRKHYIGKRTTYFTTPKRVGGGKVLWAKVRRVKVNSWRGGKPSSFSNVESQRQSCRSITKNSPGAGRGWAKLQYLQVFPEGFYHLNDYIDIHTYTHTHIHTYRKRNRGLGKWHNSD